MDPKAGANTVLTREGGNTGWTLLIGLDITIYLWENRACRRSAHESSGWPCHSVGPREIIRARVGTELLQAAFRVIDSEQALFQTL